MLSANAYRDGLRFTSLIVLHPALCEYYTCAKFSKKSLIQHIEYAKMHSIRWGDLQYILSVANEGSLSAAARSLGVNHSTVLRRLEAFESRHKLVVFNRLATGYRLTVEGQKLLDSALSVESTVKELERRIFGREKRLEGLLRVTTTDALARFVLGHHITAFHQLHPKIQLELSLTSRQLDITQMDADVAIRPASEIPEPLVGVKLFRITYGIFGSESYINSLQGKDLFRSASWLIMTQGNASNAFSENIPKENVVMRADSFEPLLIAAESAMGLAYLPRFIGDRSSLLKRIDMSAGYQGTYLWIMTHADLEKSGRVKAFVDFMTESLILEHGRPET